MATFISMLMLYLPDYVHDLMRLLMEVFEDPTSFDEEMKTIPIPPDLSAENTRTPKAELVARHVSRFNLEVVWSLRSHQMGTAAVSAAPHMTGGRPDNYVLNIPNTSLQSFDRQDAWNA